MRSISSRGSVERLVLGADGLVFGLDVALDLLDAGLVDEDLDARLELVVAASVEVVDAQDGRAVGEQLGFGQEVADLLGHHRRAALAAADPDARSRCSPASLRFTSSPMSWTWIAARSFGAPVTASLNLRGR